VTPGRDRAGGLASTSAAGGDCPNLGLLMSRREITGERVALSPSSPPERRSRCRSPPRRTGRNSGDGSVAPSVGPGHGRPCRQPRPGVSPRADTPPQRLATWPGPRGKSISPGPRRGIQGEDNARPRSPGGAWPRSRAGRRRTARRWSRRPPPARSGRTARTPAPAGGPQVRVGPNSRAEIRVGSGVKAPNRNSFPSGPWRGLWSARSKTDGFA
jgi:hypothetical protein